MTWLLGQSGNTTNYIQLIVWAILISISFIGWLMKMIVQKRAESKVITGKRQRQDDMLRTGRTEGGGPVEMSAPPAASPTPVSHEDARRRLQEVAQRRRAELEQMRQRGEQAPGSAQPLPTLAPQPMSRTMAPTAQRSVGPAGGERFPTSAGPKQPPQNPAPSRPARSTQPAPRPEQRKKKPQPTRPSASQKPTPPQPQTLAQALMQGPTASDGAYANAGAPRAPTAPIAPTPSGAATAPTRNSRITIERATSAAGVESIRRALVLAEVLAPPISLRDADHDDARLGLFGLRRAG